MARAARSTTGSFAQRSSSRRTERSTSARAWWSPEASGEGHTCGIRNGGELWCYRANSSFQCSQPVAGPYVFKDLIRVGSASDWRRVRTASQSNCALKGAGELWCWGGNTQGQLGAGWPTSRKDPTRVGTVSTWSLLDMGYGHGCGVQGTSQVACWGDTINEATGVGYTAQNPIAPTAVTVP